MLNFYQTKPERNCICESLIGYFATLSYYECILFGIGFLLLSVFLHYLLRGTSFMDWMENADRVQIVNINDGRRTVGVQTTVTVNTGEIRNSQNANIEEIHCRDNGNYIQDFTNAENDANIKNTKSMKRDNSGASPSRIPIAKHGQQANTNAVTENLQKYNMWNNNAENENPVTDPNKPEVSQIPRLTKRSR